MLKIPTCRYKCPKCRSPFCCVQCSKDHKANHCPATTKTSATESSTDVNLSCTSTTTEQQSKYLSTKELQATSQQPRRKRIRPTKSSEESDDDDDEPGLKITDEMKQKLHQSKWLRKELQDGGLRKLIESIDTASDVEEDDDNGKCNNRQQSQRRHHGGNNKGNNNTNNDTISSRELALARTKHSHPKFKSFIDEMLLTAGVLQPADNGVGGEEGRGTTTLSRILQGESAHGPLVLAPVPRRGGTHTNDTNDSGNDVDGSSSSSSNSDDSDEESGDSSDSSSEDSGDEKQK